MLGSGSYQLFVADRSGTPVGQLNGIESLRFTYERDDFGAASVFFGVPPTNDCDIFNTVKSIRHELLIVRDGEVVWEGPITRVGAYQDGFEIDAKDVSWYLTRRAMSYFFDYTDNPVDAVRVVFDTLRAEYPATGDPFRIGEHLHFVDHPNNPRTASEMKAWRQTVYDMLQRFSDFMGVDYVVRGRNIILYGHKVKVQQANLLTTEHFSSPPTLVEYGSALVTRGVSVLQDGKLVIRNAPSQWYDYYGPIDSVRDNTLDGSTTDLSAVEENTEELVDSNYPAPVEVRLPENTVVLPSAPVDFMDLMPGVWLPVEAQLPCRTVSSMQIIDRTTVVWDVSGEQVSLSTVQPPVTFFEAS